MLLYRMKKFYEGYEMKQSVIIKFISLICLILGFSLVVNIFTPRSRTFTVAVGDRFYDIPSVTGNNISFNSNKELVVLQTIKFSEPIAVIMQENLIIDGKESVKYKLRQGDVYKIADPQLKKANLFCILDITTTKDKKVKLEVPKSSVLPINEGEWIQVKERDGDKIAWFCSNSKWY